MPVEKNEFDDARLAEIRQSQEDPIVQYYIVRKDIKMSAGKACSQVAHGAQMFILRYLELKSEGVVMPEVEEWLNGSFRKVVLAGNAKDFEKIKAELNVFSVRDAGLTEVETGTETTLTTWPMRKSKQPKFLSRLRVLKNLSDD